MSVGASYTILQAHISHACLGAGSPSVMDEEIVMVNNFDLAEKKDIKKILLKWG